MGNSNYTETILIVGKKGTGKTTKAWEIVRDKTRVVVADAGFGDYGFKRIYCFPDLVDALGRGFFRISYTPMSNEWEFLIEAVLRAGADGGPIWLVLEEATRLPSPRSCEIYERLLVMGRHYNINLIALSTRPAHLPPDYRSQATRIIAFRQHERRDIDYLADVMGARAYDLPGLKLHDSIEWRETDEIMDDARRSRRSGNPTSGGTDGDMENEPGRNPESSGRARNEV